MRKKGRIWSKSIKEKLRRNEYEKYESVVEIDVKIVKGKMVIN
jgi:hypothetical protein